MTRPSKRDTDHKWMSPIRLTVALDMSTLTFPEHMVYICHPAINIES